MKKFTAFLTLAFLFCLQTQPPLFAQTGPVTDGLILWLDADDEGSFLLDEEAYISEWRDRSGQENHVFQDPVAQEIQPIYEEEVLNGKPVVRFDRDQWLQSNEIDQVSVPNTVFIVWKATADGTFFEGRRTNFHRIFYDSSERPLRLNNAENRGFPINNDFPIITTVLFSDEGGPGDSPVYVWENGESQGSENAGGRPLFGFAIGAQESGNNGIDGYIAEVLVYDKQLSDSERIQVEWYLGNKWGLEVNPELEDYIWTWTGEEGSEWENSDRWLPRSVPNPIAEVTIPSVEEEFDDPVISDTRTVSHLTIEEGASLTIAPTGRLTVFGDLNNDGTLTIQSDASGTGSLIHYREDVEATVEYYMTASPTWVEKDENVPGWHYIASPVEGMIIDTLVSVITDPDHYALYYWHEPTDTWRNHKGESFVDTVFQLGKGYIMSVKNEQTPAFSGQLNVEPLSPANLTKQGATSAYGAGWNLVGNSYASGIEVNTSDWESDGSVNLTAIKYYETDGSYGTYQTGDIIPPMTGFFVQVNDDPGTLTISPDARRHYDPSTKSSPSNENYIVLTAAALEGSTLQRSYLRHAPGAAADFDYRYDARFGPGEAPVFFSRKGEHMLMVNAISEVTEDLVIPFVFEKNHEGPEFKIALQQTIPHTDLYLIDLQEGKEHTLTADNPYVFTSAEGDDPDRFELHFRNVTVDAPTIPGTESLDVHAWVYDNTLYLDSHEQLNHIALFDMQGRQLRTFRPQQGRQSYALDLPAGVYVLRMSSQNKIQSLKIVIQ